jgi:predicted  nucleic acid-binding Zn-ribbon protein
MAKKKEISVERKLRALYDLQLVDSRIDKIRNMRGELPLEVEDLEDEVAGLTKRTEKTTAALEEIDAKIKAKKLFISETEDRIKKYKKQQENVRNNREFDALSKEIEYQELEIELAEKHIKEFYAQTEHKKQVLEQKQEELDEKQKHLDHKKSELKNILKETEKEEEALGKESEKLKTKIEDRLVKAYERIRSSVKNGLALVTIERGASGGSFFTIPPQVQVEIAARRKIITDEHSGRILVDQELAREEEERMEKVFKKL